MNNNASSRKDKMKPHAQPPARGLHLLAAFFAATIRVLFIIGNINSSTL